MTKRTLAAGTLALALLVTPTLAHAGVHVSFGFGLPFPFVVAPSPAVVVPAAATAATDRAAAKLRIPKRPGAMRCPFDAWLQYTRKRTARWTRQHGTAEPGRARRIAGDAVENRGRFADRKFTRRVWRADLPQPEQLNERVDRRLRRVALYGTMTASA